MKWVVSRTEASVRARNRRIAAHARLRLFGSIPDVGSSRSTTSGSPMNAMARESARLCPPESVPARRSAFDVKPVAAIFSSASTPARDAGIPLNRAKRRRCSRTVSVGHNTSNCGHTPMLARARSISVSTSAPSTNARPRPPSPRRRPVSTEMVVVFPAPLCPRRDVTRPRRATKRRPFTAATPPNVTTRFRARIAAGSPTAGSGSTPPGNAASSSAKASRDESSADDGADVERRKNHENVRDVSVPLRNHAMTAYAAPFAATMRMMRLPEKFPSVFPAYSPPSRRLSPMVSHRAPSFAFSRMETIHPHW